MHIIAIGKMQGAEAELFNEYAKRIKPALTAREFPAPRALTGAALKRAEADKLLGALPRECFVIALDVRGKDIGSEALAEKLSAWQQRKNAAFIIGGADGLDARVLERADFTLSLGAKTWPHMLARVMLIEQIYRAKQINAGHPYHRA
ncbi:MAG: 23S rRNA (pseudouridine(1915)-N(3))-methyltransferase RlmH [Alphaproteobacteria bacterium]|nr:23S rRNA (pseudouridine(1915)-N(3))-methyltransferase RlmH [Alphaproteobacteria bacterium]